MNLPERQRLILKEIVDRYIRYREPVSSRMILEDYGLRVSSATVRNDMGDLEDQEYIRKPYSSSGRVPTEKGYRFFVEWLLDLSELTHKEQHSVVEAYETPYLEIAETMQHTAFLLASITGCVGFVIPARAEETRLNRVVLTRLSTHSALLVVISDIGVVKHGVVPIESQIGNDVIERVNHLINDTLRGMTLDRVLQLASEDRSDGWYEPSVRQALRVLRFLLAREQRQPLFLEGMANLLPELRTVEPETALDRFGGLMGSLKDPTAFVHAVRSYRNDHLGVAIAIGDLPLQGMEGFSVVSARYGPHDGVLGIIAPLWMDYSKALSATNYVGARLEAFFLAARARHAEEAVDEESTGSRS